MDIERQITVQTARRALANHELLKVPDFSNWPAGSRAWIKELETKIPDGYWGMAEGRVFRFVFLDEADISEEEEAWDEEQFIESRSEFALFEILGIGDAGGLQCVQHPNITDRAAFSQFPDGSD